MKIFTTDHIRAIDRQTIEKEDISSRDLIERVADGVVCEITSHWSPGTNTAIFAGPGDNGADALAVGRLLIEQGFHPQIYLFNIGGNRLTPDCKWYRDELQRTGYSDLHEVTGNFNTPELNSSWLVVDGLFGSGLTEPLMGGFKSLVDYINESKSTIVAIDVPSGLFSDWNSRTVNRNVIHADITMAIQFPRLPFFFSDYAELVGEWKVIDIGLSRSAIHNTPSNFHFVEEWEIRKMLRERPRFCSKADFGSALLVAGSYGMMGAAVLAARGALRSGAGKVSVHSAQCGFEVLQNSVPEALFDADKHKIIITDMLPRHEYTAVGVGPGIGTYDSTVDALDTFLKSTKRPVVLDADALNCISRRPSMLESIPVLSVITPHAGEFDRLFDTQPSAEVRLLKAIEVSHKYNILILLKGHCSALVRPDGKVYFNSTGSPAMATGGSGDVLTGIITSLMAQGYKPEVSTLIGAYIHGRAGEIAAEEQGQYGVTAGDIADCVGRAIKSIMNK